MGALARDLKYGIRQLIRNPGLTAAAVLCLALGIGANSAAFSFVHGLLFQTAPLRDPDSLVRMYLRYDNGLQFGSWSYPDLLDLQATAPDLFAGVAGDGITVLSVSSEQTNRRIFGSFVTGNYFDLLGVDMQLGRAFLPEEDRTPGTHPVAVISHGLWQDLFGGRTDIVGQPLLLNGHEVTVIGVTPADFGSHNTAMAFDAWVPFNMEPVLRPTGSMLQRRGNHWIQSATVRLRPGASLPQVRAAADALFERLAASYPDTDAGISVDVFPESKAALHPAVRGAFAAMLTLMSVIVGFVLLLACANVAGLLVVRASARQREIGIRLALGARRRRLVRQLLTESTCLALLGGGLGVLLGMGLIGLVKSFQPPTDLPLRIDVSMDPTVLALTFALTIVTAIVSGLAPALMATRGNLVDAIKDGALASGRGSSRLRQGLVVGQVALCLVLLIAAGMVLRSLQQTLQVNIGFDPDRLAVASLDPALQGYATDELGPFFDNLKARILQQPGIEAVGYSAILPLSLNNVQRGVLPQDYEVPEGQNAPSIDYNEVDEGYFAAMGIPLLRGRAFERSDDADGAPVAIVNQAFVDRFWPGDSGLGKRLQFAGVDHEVVGVVPTGKYFSLGEDPKPYYYGARRQLYRGDATFIHVHTTGDPAAVLEILRRTVAELDPTLPLADLNTGNGALGLAFLPARLAAGVIGAFAALALLLAAVGLYGVVSFSVAQGVQEIGVRMALGARPADVIRIVVRQGMTMVLLGLGLGLAGGYLLSRTVAGFLFGTSPTDPMAYGLAIVVLAAAALTATFLPARRATHIDPLVALRGE